MVPHQACQPRVYNQDNSINNIQNLYNYLPCKTFRFSLTIKSLTILPPYKGGIFRGAFGNSFRRAVCALKKIKRCDACILRNQCLYVSLFNPSAPSGFPDAEKYSSAPPPYVLNPPLDNRQVYHKGDKLAFNLVLMGRAVEALPYFIYSFIDMGERGVGRERGIYELSKVEIIHGRKNKLIYDNITATLKDFSLDECPISADEFSDFKKICLKFITPLRMKEKKDLITSFDFSFLFQRLLHRLDLLSAFYGKNGPLPVSGNLFEQAQKIQTLREKLYWYEWERYSGNQKSLMKLGGLKGEIEVEGNLSPFMQYLKLGETVNVGQGTSFGLGKYSIQKA